MVHTLRERGKEFGFAFEYLTLDFSAAVKRSRQISDWLVKGIGFLMNKIILEVPIGTSRIITKNRVRVTNKDGKVSELQEKNIVLATGATSAVIPGMAIDGQKVLTYNEAILQTKLPKSAVIIGAGGIGIEFATIWKGYGSKVTIVEMLPRALR